MSLVHELDEKGAFLRILEPAISTDGPMGKMVLTVLGMAAEMELGFIKVRQPGVLIFKVSSELFAKGLQPDINYSRVNIHRPMSHDWKFE
jgi:DNA invertase Pin-like site-specific DNA recombinase